MSNLKHELWCEKYRPATLEDYVFHNESHRKAFTQMVANKTIPHLLLSGVQGSGKTTIAQILINQIGFDDTDVLVINASDENSVDTMRDKIKGFISTFALGEFKVVLLEEADYLSQPGQAVLRKYMENETLPARFILTCNYDSKLMPAIRSRSQHYRFKSTDKDEIAEFCAKILISEDVKFTIEQLDSYIAVGYPDIRKIVNLLQQNTMSGQLLTAKSEGEIGDYKFELLDLIGVDNWTQARKICCASVAHEEWEDVYRFLYENLDKAKKFKNQDRWEAGMTVIAEHLYKNSLCADPEINAAALFIKLSQL